VELQYKGFQTQEGSPVHEAVAAARYLTVRDGREPWIYAYTPVARMNPYQALNYGAFGDHGMAMVPVTDPWSFESLTLLSGQSRGVVLHLHWLSFVLGPAVDLQDAVSRKDVFLRRLRAFRKDGGKLVWTVHNMVPHDATFLDVELQLQQAVADEADVVHVMTEDTPRLVGEFLTLPPDRTVCVPHPSYHGAYEDYVPRDQARLALGLHPDETVYLVFGALKAYKGIENLVEGFNLLLERSDAPRRLIIAGGADRDRETRELVRQLRMNPYVLVQDTKVAADKAQYLLRSADAMVLPHVRALNSGGALLGPTFDLPVVARRVGALPNLLEPEFAEFIEGDRPEDVADALERADRLVAPEPRAAAARFARRFAPEDVSRQLVRAVRQGLGLEADELAGATESGA